MPVTLAGLLLASAFSEVVAAERAFAAASLRDGWHAAFAAAFAEDGVVLDPVPTNARAKHAGKPRSPDTLAWGPAWAAVAPAGDLALTSGPWEYRTGAEGAAATGWFFSIWRKHSDGTWRVEVDLGVDAKLAYAPPQEVVDGSPPRTGSSRPGASGRADIVHAERLIERTGRSGLGAAVSAVADPSIRVYRDGYAPATDQESVRELLAADIRAARCVLERAAASTSGDIGYAYGTCTPLAGEVSKKFGYVRVWRRQPDGNWRVFVDVTP
jgi:ketosteroid isomerase-like protein